MSINATVDRYRGGETSRFNSHPARIDVRVETGVVIVVEDDARLTVNPDEARQLAARLVLAAEEAER